MNAHQNIQKNLTKNLLVHNNSSELLETRPMHGYEIMVTIGNIRHQFRTEHNIPNIDHTGKKELPKMYLEHDS